MHTQIIKQYISEHLDVHTSTLLSTLQDIVEHKEPLSNEAALPMTSYVFHTQTPSKGMFKAVRKMLFNEQGASVRPLQYGSVLIGAGISSDTVIQLLNAKPGIPTHKDNNLLQKHIKLMRKHYNDKRIITLLWGAESEFLKDTVTMMERIYKAHPTMAYLPKKPKNLRQVHDACVRALPKINQSDFDLGQREDILMLDNKALNDELVIRVPKTHFDLVDLGEALSFCIGNGYYSNKVKNKECSIVGIFDKKGPRFGVEFTRYALNQAHGFANKQEFRPDREIMKLLENVLTEKPKMPSDFLPITDSAFVNGYRYDGKDLYLLLQQTVYVYFNVARDIYETLLEHDRKGAYFNQTIKTNHECAKIGHITALAEQ